MPSLSELKIKLFLDGAEIGAMRRMVERPEIGGFTTNPSLLRKAGVNDYAAFAREAIAAVGNRSISFEVLADDFATMEREARAIAAWGGNAYVKIPIQNTKGESAGPLIARLAKDGLRLNVTVIFTRTQVKIAAAALSHETPSIVSVFAGRVADAGIDPVPMMREAADILRGNPRAELLWASPRELLNIVQAEECGCRIITATEDMLNKLHLLGKDPDDLALEGVKIFCRDAAASGLRVL